MKLELTEPAEKDLGGLDRTNQGWIWVALDRPLEYSQAADRLSQLL